MAMMTPTAALTRYVLDRRTLAAPVRRAAEVRFGFRAGGRGYLLGAAQSVQIINAVPACALPGTPPWCAGLINLHGALVPVFDVALLDGGSAEGSRRYIMVFGAGSRSAGIYIDALPAAVTLASAPQPVDAVQDTLLRSCTSRQFTVGDRVWLETDFDRVFAELASRFHQHAIARGKAGP